MWSTSSELIWGIGPAALLPTSTYGIGANTWVFGPTIVMLKQSGSLTYGFLANQLWAGIYATAPSGGPDWQLRYTLTLLFPKG